MKESHHNFHPQKTNGKSQKIQQPPTPLQSSTMSRQKGDCSPHIDGAFSHVLDIPQLVIGLEVVRGSRLDASVELPKV